MSTDIRTALEQLIAVIASLTSETLLDLYESPAPAPEPGKGRPKSTPLSPAAQAVKTAAEEAFWDLASDQPKDPELIAAALIRHLVTLHGVTTKGGNTILSGDELLSIAAELEGQVNA